MNVGSPFRDISLGEFIRITRSHSHYNIYVYIHTHTIVCRSVRIQYGRYRGLLRSKQSRSAGKEKETTHDTEDEKKKKYREEGVVS